jgi:hypothetical protein
MRAPEKFGPRLVAPPVKPWKEKEQFSQPIEILVVKDLKRNIELVVDGTNRLVALHLVDDDNFFLSSSPPL